MLALLVTAAIALPACYLAAQQSSRLLDYLLLVVVFNRGVRRVVDYYSGGFDPYSPISLTPLFVAGLACLVVLRNLSKIRNNKRGWRVTMWYLQACLIAFIVGAVNSPLGAVYELGTYLSPLGVLGLAIIHADDPRIYSRWLKTFIYAGFGVGAYGLVQFYTIPPWDGYWLEASGMSGYMGIPEPTKMTLFSTMNERGPCAGILAGTLIAIGVRGSFLGGLRWFFAAVVLYAILLTYVRSALIQVVLTVAVVSLMNRRGSTSLIVVLALFAGLFSMAGDSLPGAPKVTKRVASLQRLGADGSLRTRIRLLGEAARRALTEPLGIGLGSHGLTDRLSSTGEVKGLQDSTGYLQILRTFGWGGALLMVACLRQFWISGRRLHKGSPPDPEALLFVGWFAAGMIVLFSGNWLREVSFFWVLAGTMVGRHDILPNHGLVTPCAGFAMPAVPSNPHPARSNIIKADEAAPQH